MGRQVSTMDFVDKRARSSRAAVMFGRTIPADESAALTATLPQLAATLSPSQAPFTPTFKSTSNDMDAENVTGVAAPVALFPKTGGPVRSPAPGKAAAVVASPSPLRRDVRRAGAALGAGVVRTVKVAAAPATVVSPAAAAPILAPAAGPAVGTPVGTIGSVGTVGTAGTAFPRSKSVEKLPWAASRPRLVPSQSATSILSDASAASAGASPSRTISSIAVFFCVFSFAYNVRFVRLFARTPPQVVGKVHWPSWPD